MKTKPERNSIALQCFFLVTRSRLNYRREKQLTKSNLTYSFHDKKKHYNYNDTKARNDVER